MILYLVPKCSDIPFEWPRRFLMWHKIYLLTQFIFLANTYKKNTNLYILNPIVIYTVDIVDHTICECALSPMSKMCQIEYLLNPRLILSFLPFFLEIWTKKVIIWMLQSLKLRRWKCIRLLKGHYVIFEFWNEAFTITSIKTTLYISTSFLRIKSFIMNRIWNGQNENSEIHPVFENNLSLSIHIIFLTPYDQGRDNSYIQVLS